MKKEKTECLAFLAAFLRARYGRFLFEERLGSQGKKSAQQQGRKTNFEDRAPINVIHK